MTAVSKTGTSGGTFNGWLGIYHWAPATLTYSFPDATKFYSYLGNEEVQALNSLQQDAIRAALAQVEGLVALTFEEIPETSSNHATLRFAREDGWDGGYAYLPDTDEAAGDAFFGKFTVAPQLGNEGFLYFIHEIGHTLGMDHGHEAPGFAKTALNSQEYTVMTYADYVGDTDLSSYDSGLVDWAQSYMQLDIAALQYLYGANYAASGELWSGDTTYGFNPDTGEMSINGVAQGAPAGNRIFRTIWDGHGNDTYDLSNYSTDLKITLAPGAFSTFSQEQLADLNRNSANPDYLAAGNVANARLVKGDVRGLIENAIGGSGNDTILGNKVANVLAGGAGDDILTGSGGADQLNGDVGADRLIGGGGRDSLSGGGGDDVLTGGKGADFLTGGAGLDVLIGGGGRDDFIYLSVTDAPVGDSFEHIRDFTSRRDDLDFSGLTDTGFRLKLNGALTGRGPSIATEHVNDGMLVKVDVSGDGMADMLLMLDDVSALLARDFIF